MRHIMSGTVLVAALFLAGCGAGSADPEPEPSSPPAPAETDGAPVLEEGAAGPWVQDLWVFERLAALDGQGTEVELTAHLLDLLPGAPDRTVELPHGATFDVHEVLTPWVADPAGERRDDVTTVAGVLRTPDGDGLAVLATPDADASAPVGLSDSVEVDVSYLGELLAPGDVLVVDYGFLQALPGADPVGADALELLAHRMDAGRIQYFGTEADGQPESLTYQGVLGRAVEGSTRTSTPAKAQPAMDGFRDGVKKCRGGLKCVSKFFQKFGGGAKGSNDLINCNLSSNCGPAPAPEPPCVGMQCGSVRGDPHLTTFDGVAVGMQGVGEFVGMRTAGLEVQLRTAPWRSSRTVSVTTGVAMDVGGTRVVVDVHDRVMGVRVDGTPIEGLGQQEVTGGTVRVLPGVVQVRTTDGHLVTVDHAGHRSFDVTVGLDAEAADAVVGLMGTPNGDPADDLQTRAGEVLEQPVGHDDLYDRFVDSWRVDDEESLFDYGPGESTQTYTDRTFPDVAMTLESLSAAQRMRAELVCRAAGIVDEAVLRECILDFAVTGDIGFVQAAQHADVVEGVRSGRLTLEDEDEDDARTVDPATVADAWSATASARTTGERFTHACPAGGSFNTVWGGEGIYTDDSSICTAAVHAGVITVQRGGVVQVEMLPGRDSYAESSTRNGVTTQSWSRPWGGSYRVAQG